MGVWRRWRPPKAIRDGDHVGYTYWFVAGRANQTLLAGTRPKHQEYPHPMAEQSGTVRLREEDIVHLLTLLQNSTTPLTTQQLVEAFKQRARR